MARTLKNILHDPFIWVMLSLFTLCNICVLVTFWTIYSRVDTTNLHGQLFAVRLMQITLGMTIGLSTTFLGIVSAWFGLTEESQIESGIPSATAKLSAAGPGALLVICGTALVFTCINREFKYESFEPVRTIKPSEGGNPPITKMNNLLPNREYIALDVRQMVPEID